MPCHRSQSLRAFLAGAFLLAAIPAASARKPAHKPAHKKPSAHSSRPRNPQTTQQNPPQQRLPRQKPAATAAIQGVVRPARGASETRGVTGARLTLMPAAGSPSRQVIATADGVFRFLDVPPGRYTLSAEADGFEPSTTAAFDAQPGSVVELNLQLSSSAALAATLRPARLPELGAPLPQLASHPFPAYRAMLIRPDQFGPLPVPQPEILPPASEVFLPAPDRWEIALPEYRRYP
ncbi:MAG: carboxypeptidase-like regulatory domain-containing protein, partial [Bryobacteraceae bacterium]